MKANIVSCARCLYDETTPGISFDGGGVCNYCAMHDNLNREYPIGVEGEKRLKALADEIRASRQRQEVRLRRRCKRRLRLCPIF